MHVPDVWGLGSSVGDPYRSNGFGVYTATLVLTHGQVGSRVALRLETWV